MAYLKPSADDKRVKMLPMTISCLKLIELFCNGSRNKRSKSQYYVLTFLLLLLLLLLLLPRWLSQNWAKIFNKSKNERRSWVICSSASTIKSSKKGEMTFTKDEYNNNQQTAGCVDNQVKRNERFLQKWLKLYLWSVMRARMITCSVHYAQRIKMNGINRGCGCEKFF